MPKYLNTKPGSLESAVLEAVSPAQQAAIAIAKKEKEDKVDEGKIAGWIANFKGKKLEIKLDQAKDLFGAKQLAMKTLKVPNSQKGLLSVEPAYEEVKKEDNTNDKSDDGEGLDKVQPKALKKKFDDRKDKDIDNDGDVDDSDEYLHNRRKTVSKAVAKEEVELDEVSNPFELYQSVKGWEKASKAMQKEMEKAKKMSDKKKARELMYKVQKKYAKFGAQDTEANSEIRYQLGLAQGEEVSEEVSLAQRTADHITNMWKEGYWGAKKKKSESSHEDENEVKKKGEKTMTGKPMSDVEVNPKDKEEE